MDPHLIDILRHRDSPGRRDIAGTRIEMSGVTSAMFGQMVEASLSGVCIVDRQGRIAYANQELLAIWGYARCELIGKPVELLWLSREAGEDCMDRALSAGRWSGVIVARRKDSSLFDVRVSVSTVRDPGAADVWFLLSCLDATGSRTVADASGRCRNLEHTIAAMPARFTDPAQIDTAIDESLKDLGRACGACRVYLSFFSDPRTVFGTTHEWCMPGRVPCRGEFQKFLTTELPWWVMKILDGETVRMDGRPGDKRISGQEREFLKRRSIASTLMIPLRLEGKVVGFVGYELDAGSRFAEEDVAFLDAAVHIIAGALERRQSESLFRESENLCQVVLDAITDAIIIVDTNFTILLANNTFVAWCEELGLETNIIGKNLFSVMPFLPTATRQQYERTIRTGRSLTSERPLQVDDRVLVVRETQFPIFKHGEVTRIIAVVRDITAQKEAEDQKTKAYSQIERNMEQFALLADHIRNPLQAILGYAELMDDPGAREKIRQQVKRIDAIIDQLDERWVESRKLSHFWRRYS
ncbi:MAG: PAS domain S-box protein [Methanomicrobiales archaeon]|jgi:PAS domain S-box-containing protein|nr:PAS domain S-box protein [Methanomicrobiales archaeon]